MTEFGGVETSGRVTAAAGGRTEPTDRRLLRAARAGSSDAVEALIERHWDRAHRIAYGILGDAHAAEDVTQEAMLSVVGGIGRFDVYRPFEPWLHRIVSNRALDWARSRARRGEVPAGSSAEIDLVEGSPSGEAPDHRLVEALATLSLEHRAVIVLRFVAGYGPDEIARILSVPRGTVGSRLRRALDLLRADLEVDDG